MEGTVRHIFRALVITVAATGIFAGSVTDSRAGVLDYIWDTSGPQFIGKVFRCRHELKFEGGQKCDPLFGRPVTAPDAPAWLTIEPAVYVSLWKNSKPDTLTDIEFRLFRAAAFGFDPMLEIRSARVKSWGGFTMYHGVGATALVIAGENIARTGNLGYKVRLLGMEWNNGGSVAFNLRLFPDGFGADEFGRTPPVPGDRPFEASIGVIVAIPYFRF